MASYLLKSPHIDVAPLCIATSVDAERAFSRGRLMVNRLRTALSDKSVRAGTVLASWAKVDGLVDETEAIAVLADKGGSRGKARVDVETSSEDELEAGEISHTEPEDDIRLGSSSAPDEPPSSDDDLYL